MINEIEGYHGTDASNIKGIIDKGFRLSIGDEEWLGDGVYFFVDGIISNPKGNAVKWAIANAWDNNLKKYVYLNYVVIKAVISIQEDTFLDLTTTEGMNLFNYLRNKYIAKIITTGKHLSKSNSGFKDGHIINDARSNLDLVINTIKGNFYIRFSEERKYNIRFRVPNSTILAVYNTNEYLERDTFEIVKNKEIKL
jgi:hypothetical protein